MIKIVLADDEPLIIKGLRKLIDWDGMGMEIVGQAGDGRELLQQMKELQPDIVISDISMPHLSGIDIIRHVHEHGWDIKVIFISAYQEFSYARDAVAFGAVDYLVKPIQKLQLEQVLHKAASFIHKHNEEERRKGKLKLYERKVHEEELTEWISSLIDGTMDVNSEVCRLLSSRWSGPLYSMGIIEADLAGHPHKWSEKENRLIEFAVVNIVQEVVRDSGSGHVFVLEGNPVYLCCHDHPDDVRQVAYDIHNKVTTFLKLGAAVGTSSVMESIHSLSDAYKQARHSLDMKYFLVSFKVIEYQRAEASKSYNEELYEMQYRIADSFMSGDRIAVREGMNRLLDVVRSAAYGNRSLAVSICFSTLMVLGQALGKSGLIKPERGPDKQQIQHRLEQIPAFDALRLVMLEYCEILFHAIEAESGSKDKALMAKVMQYIDEHYADITLESTAGVAFMNPSYFSYFFKKHTGHNFKQYVTEIRMKHAVSMLLHTDMKVYEIADKVGYNNARHFSDIFRKIYGQLPNDYRQHHPSSS
ncbi:response regulator transcription factor [Paenibacillus lemnae]|uniref:Response regulator n=1 Tax=Paenibacillus lemnae TaxID=1330551 RepID=A0A848MBA9_PAELE|nr:response regulator [Paenibacillus lemnae]NMO97965.1 response regulator [Paenibacillus lemnae]